MSDLIITGLLSGSAPASTGSLISQIRRILNDNPRIDTCLEAMDSSETGLDVGDGTLYSEGVVVEFQDNGEQCLIKSVSSNTLTVIRGYKGTTASTHDNNTTICVDPVFQYIQVAQAISASINGLYPYVYKELNDTITPVSGTKWYDSAAPTMLEISSATQITADGTDVFYYGVDRGAYPLDILHNVPTAIAASGVGYRVPFLRNTVNDININGIAPLTDTTSSGTYVDFSEGVQTDCIIYYAVARLIGATDISRTTQEDIGMSDESVKPGSRTQLSAYWDNKARQERNKWQMELEITLPRRKKWGHQ